MPQALPGGRRLTAAATGRSGTFVFTPGGGGRILLAMFSFHVLQTDGKARGGRLATAHGHVDTPAFMPVGTAGSVKGLTARQLGDAGVQIVLANAYHLMLRPGAELVQRLGGLHRLMAWEGPILTDSGGYQVFSLARLRKIDDDGVTFRSHIDGAEVPLTPRRAIEVQRQLGADIIMQLDECPPGRADRQHVARAVRRSAHWARRCKAVWQSAPARQQQALFAIQQGGPFPDLRAESARQIVDLDLPGYAVGGVSVGEGRGEIIEVVEQADNLLPDSKPRYLMGVGEPRDILAAVLRGMDMFDCVLPTRNGRNAQGFTWSGRVRLRNARHASDVRPLDENCDCYTCRNFSRGTLRHLFVAEEMLGPILVSLHNVHFFSQLMSEIRRAIGRGQLARTATRWIEEMYAIDH